MQDNYSGDFSSDIEQSLRDFRNGCLSGIPVSPKELAYFQRIRRLFVPQGQLETWRADPILLTRMQSALRRHGCAAHELQIFLSEWFLNEPTFDQDANGLAGAHRLLGEGHHRRCELGDGSAADFDDAFSHYHAALDHYTATESAEDVVTIRHELGRLFDLQGDRTAALDEFRLALAAFPEGGDRQEWAEIQNDLAMTLLKGDEADAPEAAIRHLELAMQEVNKSELPELRCTLIEGLGIAYRFRVCGDECENLKIATQYYSQALSGFAAFDDDYGCARMRGELGAVWLSRTTLGESDFSRDALDCSRLAQSFYDRAEKPYEWAKLEYQIGSALIAGSSGDNPDNRKMASIHFRNAMEVYETLDKGFLARGVREILSLNEEAVRLLDERRIGAIHLIVRPSPEL